MSEGLRMVHLRTVPDAWHAKVLAARLGAEGIVTHLQGAVAGPYPFGSVSVHVEEAQAELAADLLLADEVESAFNQHAVPMAGARLGFDDSGRDDIFARSLGDEARPRPRDDLELTFEPGDDVDLRVFGQLDHGPDHNSHHRLASRKTRALAAFAALVVAGAPVLAHFVGQ
jgi:hypothetical protein